MIDRTLCMMEIHPNLIEARKRKAEYYRMNQDCFRGMANAEWQQQWLRDCPVGFVEALFGPSGSVSDTQFP